jgi:tetratricopeptide (TPR) repeat protein
MQPPMPPPLPTDIRFATEYQKYVVYNFHQPAFIAQAKALLGTKDAAQPRILILSGERDIGRKYFINAVEYRLQEENQPVQVVTLDLNGYEPDTGTLETYVNHQLARAGGDPERASIIKKVFNNLSLQPQITLFSFVLFALVLKLQQPLNQLVTAQPDIFGPHRRPRDSLHRLLEGLCEQGNLVLHVVDSIQLPVTWRQWLLDELRLLPSLRLVFSCDPGASTEQVAPGMAALRLEFAPFSRDECRALLDQHFQPHAFPPELVDALWRASDGLPAHLAIKVFDLINAGVILRDTADVWRLAEGGLDAEECVRQFTTDLYEDIEKALAQLPAAQAGHLQRFLNCAVLCGDYIPANLILHTLEFAEEDQDALVDYLDETLLETGPIPLFRSYEYRHPAFPTQAIYSFLNPLDRGVIRCRLSATERAQQAAQLLARQKADLPVNTRGCARLVLELAQHLADADQRHTYETELAWWIGMDEVEALTRYLVAAVRQRQRDSQILWMLVQKTEYRWPAYRQLAVLDALQDQEQGLPVGLLGYFYAERAELLRVMGRYQEGLSDALAGLRFCEADSLLAGTLNAAIGLIRSDLGEYEQALHPLQRALAIYEQALGPDHPGTAHSLNNLATLYLQSGPLRREAEPLFRRALAIKEKALGPDHPDTALSFNNLAELYRAQGRYGEAEPLHQRALAIREKALGSDHPDTASSLHNLALLYWAQGRYEEAKPLFQHALEIVERALGPDHSNTASSLHGLALLYWAQGRYGEAEPLYQRALAIYEKALGPTHPNVATALKNYASLLRAMDRISEAIPLETRAQAIRARHSGE